MKIVAQQIFTRYGTIYEDEDGDYLLDSCCTDFSNINDEIEIIEEDKPIEKLEYKYRNTYGNVSQHRKSEEPIIDKINEIIDKLNELEEGKK